ncbi:hypothetical protein IAT38_001983 [Cryptococcus sp. DSM 104549]
MSSATDSVPADATTTNRTEASVPQTQPATSQTQSPVSQTQTQTQTQMQTYIAAPDTAQPDPMILAWRKEEYPEEPWSKHVTISSWTWIILVVVIMVTGTFQWMFEEASTVETILGLGSFVILVALNAAALWLARSGRNDVCKPWVVIAVLKLFTAFFVLMVYLFAPSGRSKLISDCVETLKGSVILACAVVGEFVYFLYLCELASLPRRKNDMAGEQESESAPGA